MLARITISHQLFGPRVEILLADPYTLAEGRWRWMIRKPDPASWSTSNLDTVET